MHGSSIWYSSETSLTHWRRFDFAITCISHKPQPKYTRDYCKRGNIRGTLSFADFAQNSASANSKTRENICNILYAHLRHVGVVYWPCVLMQMGNILENVWGLLCFYAAQLLANVSWYDVNFVQYKNDKWASVKREFNNPQICFCAAKRENLIPQN